MAFLSSTAVREMGFLSVGSGVLISNRASFYNCGRISIGNNVRIDDFCVMSAGVGGIVIGNFIHVAVYTALIGAGRISLADFSNISSRVSIYSSTDDFSGATMTNPMVDDRYTGVVSADVRIGRHVVVGSGSIVLPGVTIGDGVAVGALSLVKEDCAEFGIYAGTPAKFIRERQRDLLTLEKAFLEGNAS